MAAAKKKPQGASRNAPKGGGSGRKPAPGWLWMLLGVVMASFVAFLLHLHSIKDLKHGTSGTVTAEASDDSGAQGPDQSDAGKAPADKDSKDKSGKLQAVNPNGSSTSSQEPRFDFYTLLPNQKAMPNKASADAANKPATQAVQAQQSQQQQAQSQQVPADTHTDTAPQKADEKPAQVAVADKATYFLQAGSFKSEAEADNRRASVLMNGLPVKVVTIRIKEGQIWYRVVVGPLKGKDSLDSARSTLRGQGVDTVILKQG